MNVHFKGDGVDAEYGVPDGCIPEIGDRVVADGTDPDFPPGVYEVEDSYYCVGARGLESIELRVTCLTKGERNGNSKG